MRFCSVEEKKIYVLHFGSQRKRRLLKICLLEDIQIVNILLNEGSITESLLTGGGGGGSLELDGRQELLR